MTHRTRWNYEDKLEKTPEIWEDKLEMSKNMRRVAGNSKNMRRVAGNSKNMRRVAGNSKNMRR